MTGEEQVQIHSDSHGERPDKQIEKPQTSQETAGHSVIGGRNTSSSTGRRWNPIPILILAHHLSRIQTKTLRASRYWKRSLEPMKNELLPNEQKPDKESQMPVKTFDKRPDALEHSQP